MVRLAEEVLVSRLDKAAGFRDPEVLTMDPAMGTGTFLHAVLDRAAIAAEQADGSGAVAGVISKVAERLIGFELQMGPYAVAELRTADLLAAHGAAPPPGGMRLYVTDTLDDPYAALTQMPYTLRLIATSRRRANEVKAKANATVVISNPPYKELAVDDGSWVQHGGREHSQLTKAILDDFTNDVPGKFKAKLKNLYVYFWRWATWKVWESTPSQPDGDAGVVCFITTSGYLTGPAFTVMREYIRRHASEGWIIDVTPEGQTPDVPTRIFPGVRQPLAIGIFVRRPDTSDQFPATIHYRSVSGSQQQKFAALARITLDDTGWREARTGWTDPLTPAAASRWDTFPALSDLMPWYSPGVFPTRTWVYAPDPETLRRRWRILLSEKDPSTQSEMFKETQGDATLDKAKAVLPGADTHRPASAAVRQDGETQPAPVRVGYRAFDRQWVLPGSRLMDRPRPDLWAARIPGQVFVCELHTETIGVGPGVVFTGLIPDFHHFKGSGGGRTLPYLYPDGEPNIAPGLLNALSEALGKHISAADVLAYIAAVVASPAYTEAFAEELATPGIRIPITADAKWWARAVTLGKQIIWLHTYGQAFNGPSRPQGNIRLPASDQRRPLCRTPVTSMPEVISYNQGTEMIALGDGEFGPVSRNVWDYTVGDKNVIKSWFNYRKKDPGGKKTSPLDRIHATIWDPDWTTEFIDLLTVLTRLVEREPFQAEVLQGVLASDLISMDQLASLGSRWPMSQQDRKPRFSYDSLKPAKTLASHELW
jgi:predicted helicase